jgi:hypothetical protein
VNPPSPSVTPIPQPTSTPTPQTQVAEPTCDNIMAPTFTTSWVPTRIEDPDPVFAAGIMCRWQADPTVGTDNILAFGWTPAERPAWDALVTEFTRGEDSPWFVESGDRGQYLTQKVDYWVQDDEGYGSTYLFTGDAIIYAMTKAETAHVSGPSPVQD